MLPRHWLYLTLILLTGIRFFCLGQIELTPNEAYHTLWAQHPDWSYYNQGPILATTIRVGTGIFGVTEFGVRFFSPLLALGTCLILFALANQLYGETVALWSVAAINALPFFQSNSLLMTSAGVSIFLWTAAILTFWHALQQSPSFNYYWPLTGFLMGIGFLTEFTHAIALFSVILILVSSRKYRNEFARPGFWSLFLVFILLTIPVFWWNAWHEGIAWLSWRGQLMEAGLHPLRLYNYLARITVDCSPFLLLGIFIIVAAKGFIKSRHQFKLRFLLCYSLPLFGLELILSTAKSASMNSTVPAILGFLIVSVVICHQTIQIKRTLIIGWIIIGMGMIQSIFSVHSLYKQEERLSWKSVATCVGTLRTQIEQKTGKPVFIIGNTPGIASILSFYLPEKRLEGAGHPPVYIPESQMIENQFSYWPRYDEFSIPAKDTPPADPSYHEEQGVNPFIGRTALFITLSEQPPTAIQNSFERVEEVKLNDLRMPGIHFYQCLNYRSLPL